MQVFVWWILIQVLGLAALPLAYRLFKWLPGRGYAFAKPLGLLLTSYILWIGASLGALKNTAGGILVALVASAGISLWFYLRDSTEDAKALLDFVRERWRLILTVEALFAITFCAWAVLRAYAPDKIMTSGGEKFMEIAFLNATLESVQFPPHDPWLSGFAISYYYFGYVMMALMTRLSGVVSGIGFELYSALTVALTAAGAFGVVYDLVDGRARESSGDGQPLRYGPLGAGPLGAGLLGALFITILGNLEGLLEAFYARGLLPDAFWRWIDIPSLIEAGRVTGSFYPGHGWWWWRASRVLRDRTLLGEPAGLSPIDEFPFFSFLLGDNHPHVLALPFVLLAIALALNLLRHQSGGEETEAEPTPWWNPAAFCFGGDWSLFAAYALSLGALGFLNTWDYPIYVGLTVLAFGAGRYAAGARFRSPSRQEVIGTSNGQANQAFTLPWRPVDREALELTVRVPGGEAQEWVQVEDLSESDGDDPHYTLDPSTGEIRFGDGQRARVPTTGAEIVARGYRRGGGTAGRVLQRSVVLGVSLVLAGVLLYLPFYVSFSSQAGGILPYLLPPTRLAQYLVMFGPFIFIGAWFLITRLLAAENRARALSAAVRSWVIVAVAPLLVLALALTAVAITEPGRQFIQGVLSDPRVQQIVGSSGPGPALRAIVLARLRDPWLFLTLSVLIAAATVPILQSRHRRDRSRKAPSSDQFAALLFLCGLGLTFVVEFVYLRDSFGVRMNTIFKFYYQAWVMLACASAYAVWWVATDVEERLGRGARGAFYIGAVLLGGAGLVYPIMASYSRVQGFEAEPNLNGAITIARSHPDDWVAIEWLRANAEGTPVILEAPGTSYVYEGRISAFTGYPAVLGWALHESQWRGNYVEQGKREPDIETIYTTGDDQQALELLHRWDVDYVVVGPPERRYAEEVCRTSERRCSAAEGLGKFDSLLTPVFRQGQTAIYRVPEA